MAKRDIVVIGASAGGVEALLNFARSLTTDLHAAVFVVLHISAHSHSNLPTILAKACGRKVVHPNDGDTIETGTIYVAPPDHHLTLEKGNRVAVRKGPKENRFRPSVDALFRSAALLYGPRVIGVVLSGLLDDGTSGMWNIKRNGGVAVVQDPEEAIFGDMPKNVLQYVEADYTVLAGELGKLLPLLASETAPERPALAEDEMKLLNTEVVIATRDNAFETGILQMGKLTAISCPECKGALVSFNEGKLIRFRCHTGHAYTTSSLLSGITTVVEEKLWEAMQAMEATNLLLLEISAHYTSAGDTATALQFKTKAGEFANRVRAVHDAVFAQEAAR